MSSIIIFGSLNMDQAIDMSQLPGPGETVMAEAMRFAPGGKGANQAVSAARMRGRVAFIGCVGDDANGTAMVESLRTEGIDTESISVVEGVATGLAVVAVDAGGQNSIMVVPGANYEVGKRELEALKQTLSRRSTLVTQLELPHEVTAKALKLAHRQGARTILNAAPAADVSHMLVDVDVLVVNEVEAGQIAHERVLDINDARAVAPRLADKFSIAVVVTCGEEGAVVVDRTVVTMIPPFPVTAVDTVGSGDAFVGALAVALNEGQSLSEAARFGSAAGAAAATKLGAQESLPRRGDLAELFGVR